MLLILYIRMDRLNPPDPEDPHFLSQFQTALQISPILEIGKVLQYRTPKGVIQDCTIVDCGTNKLGRVWPGYAVIFGGDNCWNSGRNNERLA